MSTEYWEDYDFELPQATQTQKPIVRTSTYPEDFLWDNASLNKPEKPSNQRKEIGLRPVCWFVLIAVVIVISVHFCTAVNSKRLSASAPICSEASVPTVEKPTSVPQNTGNLNKVPIQTVDHKLDYWYQFLDGEGKQLYDVLISELDTYLRSVQVEASDFDHIEAALAALMADRPEFFWCQSWNASTMDYGNHVSSKIDFTEDQGFSDLKEIAQQIETVSSPVIEKLSGCSDYEKVKGVYEYLINNTIYDLRYDDQSLYQVLVEGHGVCAGYARSMQYLLQRLGVQTIVAESDTHAWNIVLIDGQYYHVDATFGDPIMDDGNQVLVYYYLCLPTEDIVKLQKHNPIVNSDMLPICNSMESNYYIKERIFLLDKNEEMMDRIIIESVQNKSYSIEVRAENQYVFQWLCDSYCDIGKLNSVLKENGYLAIPSMNYSTMEQLYILKIDLQTE